MRKIKWGIIGLGKIAQKFATDLLTITDAQLYAVASRSESKAIDFATKFKSEKAYGTYEDLVKDPNVEAIYIATPHPFHAAHAILCLQHQKAVLCEKPLAMNFNEVNQMIAVAKSQNVLLMEALWTRFLPHYKWMFDCYQSQKYGELLALKADFGFKAAYDTNSRLLNKNLGGGSLLDIGIYPVFLALSLLGVPKEISAKATFFETKVDSSCNLVFEYEKIKAYLKSTFLEETPSTATFIFEKATVILNTRFHQPTTIKIIKNDSEELLDFNYKTIGYNYEIAHFNQLLREGKTESDVMTFAFSKTLMKTLGNIRDLIGLRYN